MKKKEQETVYHTFPPFYQTDSKILILGTIPSVKSRKYGFYYMHPQNRFWKVLSMVLEEPYPMSKEKKEQLLIKHKIALWDVLASCEISGSSDASIQKEVPNDINWLLERTQIERIYTTGKKAYQLYQKYCYDKTKIPAIPLASTSPANCAFKLEDLLIEYRKLKGNDA